MSLPSLDIAYLRSTLTRLLETPSPVGFTQAGSDLCVELLCQFDFPVEVGRKGIVTAQLVGHSDSAPRAVTAHIDTLGAVVRAIKPNGRLSLAKLGGFSWNTMENERVTLFTDDETQYRGVILIANASHHIYPSGNGEVPRDRRSHGTAFWTRPREPAKSWEKLGIAVGDFVALRFESRMELRLHPRPFSRRQSPPWLVC